MNAKTILFTGGTLLAGLSACKNATQEQEPPMNVIYILADDLGYGDLSCYGQQKFQTPNIDRMASEGMLFTQHYAGCTVSAPSRASLMTGLHTGHTQIRGNREVKPEGQEPMAEGTFTLGKLMQEAGYTTGIFGKWGLGNPGSVSVPDAMGFDEFYGYNCQRLAHSYYPLHLWHNNEKVLFPENDNQERAAYSQDIIHEQALQFIKNNKDRPFFAMLTYTLPHAELQVPNDSIYQLFENSFEETPYDGSRGYTAVEKPRATFAAMVARLDKYVGDLLAELKELGLDENTIVFFTSDNGPHREGGADPDFFESYGPLRGTKRDLYEGGIRVPFIAWNPQKIKVGTKSEHISAFWDMMPTLSELTGVDIPVETDGISLLPTLFSARGQKEHNYLYWEFHEMGGRQALRSGNWKLIRQPIVGETALELYDLSSDLHEDNNIAVQYPDKVKELETLMNKSRTESPLFNFGRK